MQECRYCRKETEYRCCKEYYYCNPECQRNDWSLHGASCLGRSKILEDENLVGNKCQLYLSDIMIGRRIDLRVKKTEKSIVLKDGIRKLLQDMGFNNIPKYLPGLEASYEFRKKLSFLRKFDFSIRVKGECEGRWEFPEAIIVSLNVIEPSDILSYLQSDQLPEDFQSHLFRLLVAIKNNKLRSIAYYRSDIITRPTEDGERSEKDEWEYARALTLFARLLLEFETRPDIFLPFLTCQSYELKIRSVQDYVRSKLKKLHTGSKSIESIINTDNTIQITMPDFGNDVWPDIVNCYMNLNTYTYSIGQLTNKRHVTIIAKRNDYEIIGYVTCTFHRITQFERPTKGEYNDRNLQFVTSPHFIMRLFTVFSIDGLHVTESERGGRWNSIATLLIFHALYFINHCVCVSNDLGDILIASDAYARTTMLILKQFGFSHIHSLRALEWMEENPKKSDLMSEVVYYIEQFQSVDQRLSELLKEKRGNTNEEAWEMIQKLRVLHKRKKYQSDYNVMNSSWTSFLALPRKDDSWKKSVIFENELARITKLIQDNDGDDRIRVEKRSAKEELENERGGKKPTLSIHFSHQFIDLL